MKYSQTHKAEVHSALNQSAARQIRGQGIDGISVASVMSSRGLTKGGFYAHYSSREALLIEAIVEAFQDVNSSFYQVIKNRPEAEWINKVINSYLSEYHLKEIGTGCPAASLSSDIPRQSKQVKKAFENELKKLLVLYRERLESLNVNDAEETAIALFSLLMGGLQLARSVNSPKYSDKILHACIKNAQKLSHG